MRSFPIQEYQIGIISALPKELTAVIAILDEEHEPLKTKNAQDHNIYVLGQIGHHNIVAACLPVGVYGTNTAASVSKDMLRTFPHLRFGLFVGIGGGIPNIQAGKDIRLGDIVVSQPDQAHGGVIQYDLGKRLSDGRFKGGRDLNRPPTALLTALATLQSRRGLDDNPIPRYLNTIDKDHPSLRELGYCFQGYDKDQLYCTKCDPAQWWWTLWLLVLWLWPLWRCQYCDDGSGRIRRPPRTHTGPEVHYGTIASGNTLLKNARMRDQLRDDLGALCIEMEAAGVVEQFPCLVIRGICDYADAQKNDIWQEYAALTAATFAKQLLGYVSLQAAKQETPIIDMLDKLNQHFGRQQAHNIKHQDHLQLQEAFNQRQEIRYQDEQHRDCHRVFDTSTERDRGYESHKNVIPDAVIGTCRWVLDHHRYQDWLASTKDELLWISADPGCGKSVLSKMLIDTHLPNSGQGTSSPTICYFFFKDNEQQNNLAIALCAIIHQLFNQQPGLIRYALPAFGKSGEKLRHKITDLRRILESATSDAQTCSTICVLDALDECREVDRMQLIDLLCQFYNSTRPNTSRRAPLKWLVTSRPYDDLRESFDKIPSTLPSIRLAGENESDQIRSEINLVIRERVRELSHKLQLSTAKTEEVTRQFLGMEHRTYLWLHLAMDVIEKTFRDALRPADKVIPLIPVSVEEAYEKILSRINNTQKTHAMAVLTIIVGARRPLTIEEMAIALDIATLPEPPVSLSDLVIEAEHIGDKIRRWCGLFVLISGGRLYLLHQTAKEFLLRSNERLNGSQGSWKHCLYKPEVERYLAIICIRFLCLSDFDNTQLANTPGHENGSSDVNDEPSIGISKIKNGRPGSQTFLEFALEHWGGYVRSAERDLDETTRTAIKALYDISSGRYARLEKIMLYKKETTYFFGSKESDAHLVAYHGHVMALDRFLKSSYNTIDLMSGKYSTILHMAAARGFLDLVEILLEKGAGVNATNREGHTSLTLASREGHVEVVQALLDRGADITATNTDGETSLIIASEKGHLGTVQTLLDKGADIAVTNRVGDTSLIVSSYHGHLEIVHTLLDRGADITVTDKSGSTSLIVASSHGRLEIVQALLDRGAEIDASNNDGETSLMMASQMGRLETVQALLDRGADINAASIYGHTSLIMASRTNHLKIVQALLDRGADIDACNIYNETSLMIASERGRLETVQALLDRGADFNATNKYGRTSLIEASRRGHLEVVQALLHRGADFNAQPNTHPRNALVAASRNGHLEIVRALLDWGAEVNAPNTRGITALQFAATKRHTEIVQLLLQHGAQ